MKNVNISAIAAFALLTAVVAFADAWGAEQPASADNSTSPMDLVNRTPKGQLHNPYKDSDANIVSQGESLFRS